MIFGTAYYPEHRDEHRWEYDLDLMVQASVGCVRVGEFAWRRLEPADGRYDFAWMDRFVELAHARSIHVMMCTPLRTAPAWLVEQDRTILLMPETGRRLEFGGRYTFCINHPLLRAKGMALADALARHYGLHRAIHSWHLDNEYGDELDCHCPVCQSLWRRWLGDRYQDIGTLNHLWGTVFWGLEFDRFEQVPTPRPTHGLTNPAHWQAWRRFRNDATVEVIRLHAATIRSHTGARPVTTNFQTLWNSRTDYFDAARPLDVCGLNYYPGFGADYRARQLGLAAVRGCQRKNIWVLETHASGSHIPGADAPQDGELTRLYMHQIANGADGILLFRWRVSPFGPEQHVFSVTGYDGRPRGHFEEIKRFARNLRRIEPLLDHTDIVSEVAVFYDFPSRWYTELGSPWMQSGDRSLYLERCQMIYNICRRSGINVDVVGRISPLTGYRILIVPMLIMLDDALADRLVEFVEDGGVLVWHPYCGIADAECNVYPTRQHPVMERLLGLDLAEFTTCSSGESRTFAWNGHDYTGSLFFDLPVEHDAEVLAAFRDWKHGMPAVTQRRAGRGRAIHVATLAEQRFYEDFLAALMAQTGIRPILDVFASPELEVSRRTGPGGRELIFILNSGPERATIELPRRMEDVWGQRTLSGAVEVAPFGVCVLR